MEILVFGAGAMGSFFGGILSRHHDVTLVGRPDHMEEIRRRGLRIRGKTNLIARPRVATRVGKDWKPEIVLVATKAYDTAAAMRALAPLGETAMFLTLQNGLDNPKIIARSSKRVVAGTTAHGVTYVEPGTVRHAGVGETVLGAWTGVGESELVRVRDVFAQAGLDTRLSTDIRTELWAKLVVNASINPLAALAGVPNGRLAQDKTLRALVEDICREAAAVAKAEGARVDAHEIVQRTLLVARRTARNRSSMLQDLDRGRRTEIDAITGAVVQAASRHGIAVPMNRALFALVKERERFAGKRAPRGGDPLQ